jgi:hypothetical protein
MSEWNAFFLDTALASSILSPIFVSSSLLMMNLDYRARMEVATTRDPLSLSLKRSSWLTKHWGRLFFIEQLVKGTE